MGLKAGFSGFVGTGVESTWGSKVAMSHYNRFVSQSFVPASEMTDGNKSLGKAARTGRRRIKMRSEGDIEFPMRYQGFERWLKALFGTCTTTALTGADTGAYEHVFTLNSTRPTGLTTDFNVGDIMFPMPGLKLNKGTFRMGMGIMAAVFGGAAKPHETGGSVDTPTYAEDVNSGATNVNSVESGYAGSVGAALRGFSFQVGTAGTFASPSVIQAKEPVEVSVEAPFEAPECNLGNPIAREPLLSDVFTVAGSISRNLLDDSFLDYWLAGDPLYFRFQYDGPGPVIVSGTVAYMLRVDIPYALVTGALGPIDKAGAVEEKIPFEIDPPSDAAANMIVVTVRNKLASVT